MSRIVRILSVGALIAGVVVLPAPTRAGDVVALPVGIHSPVEGSFLATRSVAVRGTVHDPSLSFVVVNGKDVPVEGGRFHVEIEAAAEGEFEVRVAYGAVGKPAAILKRTVHIDETPPSLDILFPRTREADFTGAEGTIRGRASDANLARVTMNNVDVEVGRDGSFAVPFLLPPAGDLVVEVAAIDRAGNRRNVSRVMRRGAGVEVPSRRGVAAPTKVAPEPSTAHRAVLVPPTRAKSASDVSARAVDEALGWLAAHQSADGGFEAEGFGSWCDRTHFETPGVGGRGRANYDVGVTGFAVLAFLGAGYTNRSEGPYGRVVGDALRFLRNAQDTEGCIGSRTTGHYIYNHAIAALAMVEAYEKTESSPHKVAAQKALDFIAVARNPYFAWRYGIKPGDNDTSITGWMLHALVAARRVNRAATAAGKDAPFEIEEEAFEGANQWIEKMTDPDTGRVGYQQRGTGPARTSEMQDKFPADRSEAMTAVGLYARLRNPTSHAAADPLGAPAVRLGLALLDALPPVWNPEDGSIDVYYWYYGSLACHAAGGATWEKWQAALIAALVPAQRTDGDSCSTKGSFDPIDPWGGDGGRVYMTAIAALCLETADRDEPSLSK